MSAFAFLILGAFIPGPLLFLAGHWIGQRQAQWQWRRIQLQRRHCGILAEQNQRLEKQLARRIKARIRARLRSDSQLEIWPWNSAGRPSTAGAGNQTHADERVRLWS